MIDPLRQQNSPAYADGVQAGLRAGPYEEYQTLDIKPRVPYVTETQEETDWFDGFRDADQIWRARRT